VIILPSQFLNYSSPGHNRLIVLGLLAKWC